MLLQRFFFVALCLLFAGCATLSPAGSLPSGDTRHWKIHRIEIGNHVVQFTIPTGESSDWPAFEVPKQIDLSKSKLFNDVNQGPDLLSRFWDYRISRYGDVDGTLRAVIILWNSDRELSDEKELRDGAIDNDELEKNRDVKNGRKRAPNEKRYEQTNIAGKKGYLVHQRISGAYYIVPVDLHHYLTIYVGTDVTRSGWREDSKSAAEAILQSIKIEPK